tara:strand:+ start:1944 stop:3110 length:1167 start_codon:yes stop_codon:yes gene_type:complete
MIKNIKKKKYKVVFLANTSWYFYNFRLSLIEFLTKNNYEIHLICPYDKYTKYLKASGIAIHNWDLKSSSANLIKEIKSIYLLYKIYKEIEPDISHNFTIKCVMYGTLISNICNIKYIFNSITGLGNVFISNKLKYKFINFIILPIYKLIIKSSKTILIFQNNSDLNLFIKKNISNKKNSFLIRGSGIDTEFFKNNKKIKSFPRKDKWQLLFPSRLTREKGINELIIACDNLWIKTKNFRLFLAGDIDCNLDSNLNKKYLDKIKTRKYIKGLKHQTNMRNLYLESDIVILPSWREGLSKSLLEAGSMEIPIITTNVPGCKDIVSHRKTGLLVNKKDPKSIENALYLLMSNQNLCKKLSKNIRIHIERNFTNDIINKQTFELYKKIMDNR